MLCAGGISFQIGNRVQKKEGKAWNAIFFFARICLRIMLQDVWKKLDIPKKYWKYDCHPIVVICEHNLANKDHRSL